MRIQELGILVLDDVNAMRAQIKDLLRSVGFERIFVAPDGARGIELLQAERIHLVLADWHMTPVDGFELLRYIRSRSEFAQTAFIMVTAESTKDLVVRALQGGVDEYVLKPLTLDQIQKKVLTLIAKKGLLI